MSTILAELSQVLEERKISDPESSYVASLHSKGFNKILEKVGEEAIETIIAAKDAKISGNTQDLIYETADLWFHTMVMLSHLDCGPQEVLNELARRFGISGITEHASRNNE